ncbi:MAG: spore germination protein [Eubacteriales bacterium]
MQLSTSLQQNIALLKNLLPLNKSFDINTRSLYFGKTKAYWIGINGFCNMDLLQKVFTEVLFSDDVNVTITDVQVFMESKIGYLQTSVEADMDTLLRQLLSGPSFLLIDGFSQAIILDTRSYPTRSIAEPELEKVARGSKDGFVETLLFNTNLIRRRIRSTALTFEVHSVGTESKSDVCLAYLNDIVDTKLLKQVQSQLQNLDVTCLTMGSKSLDELLLKKKMFHPLPSFFMTERPDVACSYLSEGYIIIIVDTSPSVLVLPCCIFQFTQSPEDYYKSPDVGNYLRLVRFGCILLSLLLMPLFLLLGSNPQYLPKGISLLPNGDIGPITLFIYVLFMELGLDLFKYASSHSPSGLGGSFGLIGGLLIGDVAVTLEWASIEVIFYGAATLLTTLGLSSIEFGEGIRMYRIFLVLCTGFWGLYGFIGGLLLIIWSTITTPTFGHKSYIWPLFPFHWKSLKTLLFRYPTFKAQPTDLKTKK